VLTATISVARPALEALDAADGRLPQDSLEPTAMWLSKNGRLSAGIQISLPKGKPARSADIMADLYDALSNGLIAAHGDDFILTTAGLSELERTGQRASTGARHALHSEAPPTAAGRLAAIKRLLT
jgi:hypothetical protein